MLSGQKDGSIACCHDLEISSLCRSELQDGSTHLALLILLVRVNKFMYISYIKQTRYIDTECMHPVEYALQHDVVRLSSSIPRIILVIKRIDS